MATNDVEVKLGAETSGLESGMRTAADTVKNAMSEMTGGMTAGVAVGTALGTVLGSFLVDAFARLGAALKACITDTAEYHAEAERLARVTGTNVTETTTLMQALDNIYVSTSEYTGALKGLERQLRTNEASINAQGIVTRDTNGNLRDTQDIMFDALQTLKGYKEGVDRNIESQKIFGRGLQDGSRLVELNREELEKARITNEELNLVIGKEGKEAFDKYRASMKDVDDVSEGFKNTIGTAVMPMLTQFAEWFRSIAPTAIASLKYGLATILTPIYGIIYVLNLVVDAFKNFFNTASIIASSIGEAIASIWNGKMSEIPKIFAQANRKMVEENRRAQAEMLADTDKVTKQMALLWGKQTPDENPEGGDTAEGKKKGADARIDAAKKVALSLLAIERERVNQARALDEIDDEEKTRRMKALVEREYKIEMNAIEQKRELHKKEKEVLDALDSQALEATNKATLDKLRLTGDLNKQNYAENKQIRELEINDAKNAALATIEAKRGEVEQARALDKISAEERTAALIDLKNKEKDENLKALNERFMLYIADKVKRDGVLKEIVEAERKSQREITELHVQGIRERFERDRNGALADIDHRRAMQQIEYDMQKTHLDQLVELGAITNEEKFLALKEYASKEYQSDLQQLMAKQALYREDSNEYQALTREKEMLDANYRKKQYELDVQVSRERMRIWQSFKAQISTLWDKGITALMNGTLTFRNAFRAVFTQLVGWFATEVIGQMVKRWLVAQALKMGIIKADAVTEQAIATQAAISQAIQQKALAIGGVTANAAIAATAAMASVAAIPYVGWAMAPEVGATTYATAMGYMGSIAFAEGGYDIPKGVNPMTQLHQNEMVLPSKYADVIRDMAEGGGGGNNAPVNVNITAMDAKSVRDYFKNNSHTLAPALRNMARNFTPKKA